MLRTLLFGAGVAGSVSAVAVSHQKHAKAHAGHKAHHKAHAHAKAHTFGPNACVSVKRNAKTGTCVIETDCASEVSLDTVEFAFTCQLPTMLQKHSFGKGGFDSKETFDTSVKCDACGLPAEVLSEVGKVEKTKTVVKAAVEVQAVAKAETGVEAMKRDAVTYGPSNCVSTWLKPDTEKNEDGEHGTCQVETKCENEEDDGFQSYPMGLICVDKDQLPTRHLFGSNSFDKQEKFDTLIRCTTCLGLDKVSESVTLEATVKSLAKEVYEIKDEVYQLEKNVDGTFKSNKITTTTAAPTTTTTTTTTTTAAAAEAAETTTAAPTAAAAETTTAAPSLFMAKKQASEDDSDDADSTEESEQSEGEDSEESEDSE